ncbi:putative CheW protein [Trichinella spiralis]|uniref:putative CheW protein n=1 Tax=Trichinella spiralis TaxID=6334 RepID=UPI0001EFD760|nr:putative CheW protein [Trichinella spiralis]
MAAFKSASVIAIEICFYNCMPSNSLQINFETNYNKFCGLIRLGMNDSCNHLNRATVQITQQCIITKVITQAIKYFFTMVAYNKSGFHVAALDLMRLALFATLHSSVQ